jgi:Mg-chelatase subunit ChlD
MGLKLNIKFRVLGFRDHSDSACIQQMENFTENTAEVNSFLKTLQAQGGDDGPEEVVGALECAAGWADWSGNAKFLIFVGDSPGHGRSLNNDPDDQYPDGHPGIKSMREVVSLLNAQNIDLFFCRINKVNTARMEKEIRRHYDNIKDKREMVSVDLFNAAAINSCKFHVVFVLDESGSMSNITSAGTTRWQQLKNAFNKFIRQRMSDQAAGDVISVVTFDHEARVRLQRASLKQARAWNDPPCSGGTNFYAGLDCAMRNVLQQHDPNRDGTPVVIFMSDGDNTHGDGYDCEAYVRNQMMRRFGNLKVHTVGFAEGANSGELPRIAAAGGGRFQSAQTERELLQVFAKLASGGLVLDSLVNQLASKVSEKVSHRILTDYL